MIRRRQRRAGGAFALMVLAGCNGTTGDALVTFSAYASGVPAAGTPFSRAGYSVTLTAAKMRLGAIYVNQAPLATGAEGPGCIDPGVYAAQVPGGVEADLLSSAPQEFSVYGSGTADVGASWEIWLTDGDVNSINQAHVVDLEGVATRAVDGARFSFAAIVTINGNRLIPVSDPAQPGLNPICKQRIVQLGGIDLRFAPGGALFVRVDPRGFFAEEADFATLPPVCDPAFLPRACVESANCQLGGATGNPDLDYGNGRSCSTSVDCDDAFVCNPSSAMCVAQYCIPDSNFASGAGATQGLLLFTGIHGGGAATYDIRYGN